MMRQVLFALALVSCGKVDNTPQDAAIDAPLADALSCQGPELACGSGCVDPMTSNDNCGGCGIQCTSDQTSCVAGHCVDFTASCATIHAHDPAMPNGFYTLLSGSSVFCDMGDGTGTGYNAVGIGQYDVAHTGWKMVSPDNFADAGYQKAFIKWMNAQGGALRVDPGVAWSVGNCCFKASTNANEVLEFGAGNYLEPTTGSPAATTCGGSMTASTYGFALMTTPFALPLPDTFFATHAPGVANNCGDATNPAFFFRLQ